MKSSYFFILLIFIGIVITSYASWEIYQTKSKANETLVHAKDIVETPTVKKEKERFLPIEGETVGILEIPVIDAELAIVEGTDPDELKKGVGHYKDSYYPGEGGQIVLSGHRDTVFTRLEEVKLGDELRIKLGYGKFSYRIINTKIVDAEDTSVITLQNNKEELILTTCYPFGYIGNAPQRYIIYAEKVKE